MWHADDMADSANRRGSSFYDAVLLEAYLAHRHAPVTSPNLVMEEPAFRRAAGELRARRILDLGCGDGTFATVCDDHGCASYLGVDGSASMIERATSSPRRPGIEFRQLDIEDFRPPPAAFDLVAARLVLHYLPDLDSTLDRARASLDADGRLVFTVVHPVVTAGTRQAPGRRRSQLVEHYFEPGERRRQWFGQPVTWQHRTIEQYLDAVMRAGFAIDTISECPPDEALFAGDRAEYQRRRQVPLFLLVGATAA